MIATTNKTLRSVVLSAVEKFLDKSEISATRFGYMTCGDPGFVRKLRDGRDFRATTLEKVSAFMARHRQVRSKR